MPHARGAGGRGEPESARVLYANKGRVALEGTSISSPYTHAHKKERTAAYKIGKLRPLLTRNEFSRPPNRHHHTTQAPTTRKLTDRQMETALQRTQLTPSRVGDGVDGKDNQANERPRHKVVDQIPTVS